MPVSCKLLPLSDLFMFNTDKTVDEKAAAAQFLAALDQYCANNKCKQPSPDKPKPGPATVKVQNSNDFGGTGGGPFEWKDVHPTLNVHKIYIRSGTQIDNIQI